MVRTLKGMYSYHVEIRRIRVVGDEFWGKEVTREEQGLAPVDRDDFFPEQVSGIPDSPKKKLAYEA